MVYVRKSRRARREEEEEGDKDAGAVAKEVTSPPAEEELSYRRRRRYANRDAADVETAQTEAAEEREESGSSDRYRRRLERDRYFTQAIVPSAVSTPSPPPSGASPVGNMATTAAGNKLAKEINDEFLTCKICLEGFKTPKCLDCLHTFCEQCIDNHVLSECSYKKYSDYREFTCPLCRKRTQLPIGGVKKLPDNFLVSSLNEVVSRQKPSKYPFCDICKLINRKHREATSKCLDCNKLLCKPCVDMHKETRVTSNHSLFDVEIEKDIECKEHQDEVVRFYCEPCQACICVLCTFNEHKDHEISQFSDAVNKYKETIQALLGDCKGKIDVYDRQLALLNRCEGSIKNTEQRIHDAAIQFIAEVRTKEKALVDELHAVYGKELMQYMERKDEMQTNLDSLKSTCNLTELVLKGKDIELLLLKRQVEEKLSVLANVELKDLPRTIGKQITFVTGSLELGRLDDPDVPSEMKKKGQANSLRNNEENSQKLTLPNMIFGQTRSRDIDTELFLAGGEPDPVRLAPKPIPKRTVDTQTDSPLKQSETTKKTFGNRCIQTEYPERYDNLGFGFSRGHSSSGSQETRGTETDVINTVEKAVNTPTRSLQSLTSQLERSRMNQKNQSGDEASPTTRAEAASTSTSTTASGNNEQTETASQRRHRRRRERARALEVSVRPTTLTSGYGHAGSSDGYAGDGDGDAEASRVDECHGRSRGGRGDGGGHSVVVVSSTSVDGSDDIVVDVEETVSGTGSGPHLPVLTYSSSIEESVFVAKADTPTNTVHFIAPGVGEGESNFYVPYTGGTMTPSPLANVSACSDNVDDNDKDNVAFEKKVDELSVTAVITSLDLGGSSTNCVETISDTEQSAVATICASPVTFNTVANNTRTFGKGNASTSPPRF